MARCPDCGGEMKYKAPFMVCLDCGLSVRREEYERLQRKVREEFVEEIGISEAEKERRERARKRAYMNWILKEELQKKFLKKLTRFFL